MSVRRPRAAAVWLAFAWVVGCGRAHRLPWPDAGTEGSNDGGVTPVRDAGPARPDPDPLRRTTEGKPLRPVDGCVEVLRGQTVSFDLEVVHERRPLELVFLVDATASMGSLLPVLRDGLGNELRAGVLRHFPGLRTAAGIFSDFPVSPYGNFLDVPFERLTPLDGDLTTTAAALKGIRALSGLDVEESQIEALYQTATNDGGRFVAVERCPAEVGEEGGPPLGAFCAHAGPTHDLAAIVATDSPPHNGPRGYARYDPDVLPGTHGYDVTLDAMEASGFRPIFLVPDDHRDIYEAIATDMGSVDASGAPVVMELLPHDEDDPEAWGAAIIDGLVDALDQGVNPVDGSLDLTLFIEAVRGDRQALAWIVEAGAFAVTPEDRATPSPDGQGFDDVRAGARLRFRVTLRVPSDLPDEDVGSYGLRLRIRRRIADGADDPRYVPWRERLVTVYAGARGHCPDPGL